MSLHSRNWYDIEIQTKTYRYQHENRHTYVENCFIRYQIEQHKLIQYHLKKRTLRQNDITFIGLKNFSFYNNSIFY